MLSLFGQERVATAANRVTASAPQQRLLVGLVLSVTFHVAVGASVLPFTQTQEPRVTQPARSVPPRLVSLVYLSDAPDVPVLLPAKEPAPPTKAAVKMEEPLPKAPKPLPERTVESSRADITPTPERLPVEAPPKPLPLKPSPAVAVG